MNNAQVVQRLQRLQDLPFNAHGFRSGNRPAGEPVSQRLPIEEFQHQHENLAIFKDVENLAHARMVHARKRSCFAPQPAPGVSAFGFIVDGLNGNRAFQALVPAFVDHTHSTFADFAPDPVVANGFEHPELS